MTAARSKSEIELEYFAAMHAAHRRHHHDGGGSAERRRELDQIQLRYHASMSAFYSARAYPARGKKRAAPVYAEDDDQEEDDDAEAFAPHSVCGEDEEASVELSPAQYAGKGGTKFAAMVAAEAARAKKRLRLTPEDFCDLMRVQVQRMLELWVQDSAWVTLTTEQYCEVLRKFEPNLAAMEKVKQPMVKKRPTQANETYAVIAKLRDHVWDPRPLTVRLPVDSKDADPKSCKGEDMGCKACGAKISGQFVRNLRCMRTKYCPPCAAVMIDAVGREAFFRCTGATNFHDAKTGAIGTKQTECRHKAWAELDPELAEEIAKATEIFTRVDPAAGGKH